jgi:hypothetical protein
MNKRGRPKNKVPSYRTSNSFPATFDNTLRIIKYKLPELKQLTISQNIVKALEMIANGDLIPSEQYIQKQKRLKFDDFE